MVSAILPLQLPVPRSNTGFINSPVNELAKCMLSRTYCNIQYRGKLVLSFIAHLWTSELGADNTVEYFFPLGRETNA
jgi:hypothetical protein